MLGHLKPSLCSLDAKTKYEYRTTYCSLCASLRKQNNNTFYSLFINHELTLLLLALKPYFKEELKESSTPCPAAAFTRRNPMYSHPVVDIAGRLSMALGYIKIADSQTDKPTFWKNVMVKKLNKSYKRNLEAFDTDMKNSISEYLQLTTSACEDYTQELDFSGKLSAHAFLHISKNLSISSETAILFEKIFYQIGRLISITDHLIDLEKDKRQKQYNPILYHSQEQNIKIEEAYSLMLRRFNESYQEIFSALHILQKQDATSLYFVSTLQKSLKRSVSEIKQSSSFHLRTCEVPSQQTGMSVAKADCFDACASDACSECCNVCGGAFCTCMCESICSGSCNDCCDGDGQSCFTDCSDTFNDCCGGNGGGNKNPNPDVEMIEGTDSLQQAQPENDDIYRNPQQPF